MLRRRIAYGMALIAALFFQICFTDYLSHFVLILVLIFPLFSLLLSLPGLLGCRISLSPETAGTPRGTPCRWVVTVENPTRLPLARLTYRLREENRLTGGHAVLRRTLTGASQGHRSTEHAAVEHCGLLCCTLQQPKICDLLGLFTRRLPVPPPAQMLVLPIPADVPPPPPVNGGVQDGTGLRPRPGGGPGEDYDLRTYRPGDPIRAVHWKLSSKRDELIVRESLAPPSVSLVLTLDLFGTPEDLDRTLDRLYAVSHQLIQQGRSHFVQWARPDGQIATHPVDSERTLLACLTELCASPAPLEGKSMLDLPPQPVDEAGSVRRVHLSEESDRSEGGAHP